jgi:hypothetical protein
MKKHGHCHGSQHTVAWRAGKVDQKRNHAFIRAIAVVWLA